MHKQEDAMMHSLDGLNPVQIRHLCGSGAWTAMTGGAAPGHYQPNLAIVSMRWADAFQRFCERNPAPCPILDITMPGDPEPQLAAGADIRTDLRAGSRGIAGLRRGRDRSPCAGFTGSRHFAASI